jgi:hypothetical protein
MGSDREGGSDSKEINMRKAKQALGSFAVAALANFSLADSHAQPVHAEMFDVPYVCSITFTIRSGHDGLRGGEYDGDVYANIRIADHWYPLTRDRTGLNLGVRWLPRSVHSRTIDIPGCLVLDERLQAIRLHTRFAGGVFGNNWDMLALTIGWSGHMTSKRGGGLRSITGYFYRGMRGPALCRFSGEKHDFDVAIPH